MSAPAAPRENDRAESALPLSSWPQPLRDPAAMLQSTLMQWGGDSDLWLFGYASLIWRPDFDFAEQRAARTHGWHRALQMWSRINRGTPDVPGLVFALLPGGSCQGAVFRVPQASGSRVLKQLWQREMPTGVYDPRWLRCSTPGGPVSALAFTLSRRSPNYTGDLPARQLRSIFANATGRYGTTRDYALQTWHCLSERGIHDAHLLRLLNTAGAAPGTATPLAPPLAKAHRGR